MRATFFQMNLEANEKLVEQLQPYKVLSSNVQNLLDKCLLAILMKITNLSTGEHSNHLIQVEFDDFTWYKQIENQPA